jgi:hypothetical protein
MQRTVDVWFTLALGLSAGSNIPADGCGEQLPR